MVEFHFPVGIFVSIHAPARGATLTLTAATQTFPVFQSTLPRGERPTLFASFLSQYSFNPRSREGSDFIARRCIKKQ